MALAIVNQDSGALLTITFYDDFNQLVIPATATYKVTDVNSFTELLPDTSLSPLASEVSVEIAPSINALINQRLEMEPKAITVKYSFWNGTQTVIRKDEFRYSVARLYGQSDEDHAL